MNLECRYRDIVSYLVGVCIVNIDSSPLIDELNERIESLKPQQKGQLSIQGPWGSSRSMLMAVAAGKWRGLVVVIVPSQNELTTIATELEFFTRHILKNNVEENLDNRSGKELGISNPTSIDAEELREPQLFQGKSVNIYPSWELLPLESMSPDYRITRYRISALYNSMYENCKILVTTHEALMHRAIITSYFFTERIPLELYQEVDRTALIDSLHNRGYRRVDIVEEVGDYALRGGVIDMYLPIYLNPIRLEFMGDEIESIREFDVTTQRSLRYLLSIELVPAREFVFSQKGISRASSFLESLNYSQTIGKGLDPIELLDRFERRQYFEGIEWYLPLFEEELHSLSELLPDTSLLMFTDHQKIVNKIEQFDKNVSAEFRHFKPNYYPYFPREHFYLSGDILKNELERYPQIRFSLFGDEMDGRVESASKPLEVIPKSPPFFAGKLAELYAYIAAARTQGKHVVVTAPNAEELAFLERGWKGYILDRGLELPDETSEKNGLANGITHPERDESSPYEGLHYGPYRKSVEFSIGAISGGFELEKWDIVVITSVDIFGSKQEVKSRRRFSGEDLITSFRDLKTGDLVVHVDHGIGRYMGTEELEVQGITRDFIVLQYAGDDKLFVPMERINLLQRYASADNAINIRLDKLGSTRWQKTKEKVKKSIRDMAFELIGLYATREVIKGVKFPPDDGWQREFEFTFPFEETPDQMRAIEEVKRDMESDRPMDRLICGDVGFGKTEVAMRAAFKAVSNSNQVAILTPTTILAHQHYLSFSERFSAFPITIEMLSRFRTKAEQKRIINDLSEGKIDIIIGTHRLLQEDIQFLRLGLIVIDEEHRFGVGHKEKLKSLRKKADVLTLTATPIPRTLHMSLSGLRDMSIINTPPENRLPIVTKVCKFNVESIRKAIRRELQRGGQVYFLHNRVRTIHAMASFLKRTMPELSLAVAHGQMEEGELKSVMRKFLTKELDVLVCTTIIESGIDIPSVNTMIINRADKLGLSQLYQLRGRVGRSHHRAYCYLLIPDFRLLTPTATQRLKVLQELTELGSGFRVAAHDMEIRGAGNLLGRDQHGHINAVGFDLYCSLLEEAVRELKDDKKKIEIEPEVIVPFEAYIPKSYIPDNNQRLMLYRKLNALQRKIDIDEFEEELRDRFGPLPLAVRRLLVVRELCLDCATVGITKLELNKNLGILQFQQLNEHIIQELMSSLDEEEATVSFPTQFSVKLVFAENDQMMAWDYIRRIVKRMVRMLNAQNREH